MAEEQKIKTEIKTAEATEEVDTEHEFDPDSDMCGACGGCGGEGEGESKE